MGCAFASLAIWGVTVPFGGILCCASCCEAQLYRGKRLNLKVRVLRPYSKLQQNFDTTVVSRVDIGMISAYEKTHIERWRDEDVMLDNDWWPHRILGIAWHSLKGPETGDAKTVLRPSELAGIDIGIMPRVEMQE